MSEEKKNFMDELKKELIIKSKKYFGQADLDKTGVISMEEWIKCEKMFTSLVGESFDEKFCVMDFKSFDENSDGFLTEEEFVNGSLYSLTNLEEDLDSLSIEDLNEFKNNLFERMDKYINLVK
jgi:hypothetical protein